MCRFVASDLLPEIARKDVVHEITACLIDSSDPSRATEYVRPLPLSKDNSQEMCQFLKTPGIENP